MWRDCLWPASVYIRRPYGCLGLRDDIAQRLHRFTYATTVCLGLSLLSTFIVYTSLGTLSAEASKADCAGDPKKAGEFDEKWQSWWRMHRAIIVLSFVSLVAGIFLTPPSIGMLNEVKFPDMAKLEACVDRGWVANGTKNAAGRVVYAFDTTVEADRGLIPETSDLTTWTWEEQLDTYLTLLPLVICFVVSGSRSGSSE